MAQGEWNSGPISPTALRSTVMVEAVMDRVSGVMLEDYPGYLWLSNVSQITASFTGTPSKVLTTGGREIHCYEPAALQAVHWTLPLTGDQLLYQRLDSQKGYLTLRPGFLPIFSLFARTYVELTGKTSLLEEYWKLVRRM